MFKKILVPLVTIGRPVHGAVHIGDPVNGATAPVRILDKTDVHNALTQRLPARRPNEGGRHGD